MAEKEFPQKIYLKLETETNDDPYFVHYDSADEVAEPGVEIEVGIYQFVRKAKVSAPIAISEN